MNIIIVGCSERKLTTQTPVAAIDLYQGGYVPLLRSHLHAAPLNVGVFILSAKYGLLAAADQILPYNQPLTPSRAEELRPLVWADLQRKVLIPSKPEEILIIIEPLYLLLVADIFGVFEPRPKIYWEPNIKNHSPLVDQVLAAWQQSDCLW